MSNYTKSVNFATKDGLISGNPLKLVRGTEIDTEFNNLVTAIATKIDGTVVFAPNGSAVQPSYGFTANAGVGMYNAAGVLGFATGGIVALTISAAGNVVVTPPTSGTAVTINQVAGQAGLILNPADSASIGIRINDPGANNTDMRLETTNSICLVQCNGTSTSLVLQSSGGTGLTIAADKGTFLGAATGSSQGAGTLNAQGLSINANPVYAGIPINAQAANYTCVLADANKCISNSGAANTTTIPANASVPYPLGTAITFYNNTAGNMTIAITTDNMRFGPGGALGSRTLGQNGVATALKFNATAWVITGTNLS